MKEKIIQPKNYDFSNIKGISMNQLQQHYTLYKGYVSSYNKITAILNEKNSLTTGATYSEARSLALGETFSLNGTKLHQYYFENLGSMQDRPFGLIYKWITEDYGSFSHWKKRFTEIALSVRGWVVYTYDPIDSRTHIIGQDSHDMVSIWSSAPLLVLDVYEHAYMIDFGIDRKAYLEVFYQNINWEVVNERAAEAMITLRK